MVDYTEKQGQYLAFIYYYTKIHHEPPAEADLQRYFQVTPPTVHQMIVRLDEKGLIAREPGKAHTIRVLVPPEALPDLGQSLDHYPAPVKLPFETPADFRIIAHRGASAYAPENTFAAFDLALEMGVREIEMDAQLSADGVVVLCHDATLEKYGHGRQLVEQTPWEQLAQLDMGSWFSPFLFPDERMPTLRALFKRYSATFTYHIEIKGDAPGLPCAIHRDVEAFGLRDHCLFTSFSYEKLARMKAIAPHARLGWLVESIDDEVLEHAERLGLFQLCPAARPLTREAVQAARTVTHEVRAWGINGSRSEVLALIQHTIRTGCDGMTIDWPDWISH